MMVSEDQLIQRVSRRFPSIGKRLRVGIGDDAAVLRPGTGAEWVVTTDAFLENVHFLRKVHPPKAVGYKGLARAASDLAAMGARPKCFFLTLGLPEACTGPWLDEFLYGMARAARRSGLVLAGGDTSKYPVITISVTVVGEVDRGKAILRSGARPGDLLCVSGRLGEAELGLRLIQGNLYKQNRLNKLVKKHLYPEPRLAVGEWLAAHRFATSMIDTSDGLSTDLGHLCKASGVGAVVRTANIPKVRIPAELQRLGAGFTRRRQSGFGASATLSPPNLGLDPLELALNGGEDYELLFTVPKKLAARLPHTLGGIPITVIGEITRAKRVLLKHANGQSNLLKQKGWDPFRK